MRSLLICVLVSGGLLWGANEPVPVNTVVKSVRDGIRKKTKDAEVAAAVAKLKLSQCLEDRVLEILESEGAGPQTLGALQQLRDASQLLPQPPEPPAGMAPPPTPTLAAETQAWEATSAYAARYIDSLPNFICSRTVHRWMAPAGTENWAPSPTLAGDLTYFEGKETFTLRTIDGKPFDQPVPNVGGSVSHGEFGLLLATIFRPASQTYHRWDHWTILRKRPTWVYFFRIPAARGPHFLQFQVQENGAKVQATTGARGFIYVDVESNSVTRIIQDAEEIPPDFPIRQSSVVLDYDYGEIGGKLYFLPLRAEVRAGTADLKTLNSVEFHSYRKFDANSSIQYGVPVTIKR